MPIVSLFRTKSLPSLGSAGRNTSDFRDRKRVEQNFVRNIENLSRYNSAEQPELPREAARQILRTPQSLISTALDQTHIQTACSYY